VSHPRHANAFQAIRAEPYRMGMATASGDPVAVGAVRSARTLRLGMAVTFQALKLGVRAESL